MGIEQYQWASSTSGHRVQLSSSFPLQTPYTPYVYGALRPCAPSAVIASASTRNHLHLNRHPQEPDQEPPQEHPHERFAWSARRSALAPPPGALQRAPQHSSPEVPPGALARAPSQTLGMERSQKRAHASSPHQRAPQHSPQRRPQGRSQAHPHDAPPAVTPGV